MGLLGVLVGQFAVFEIKAAEPKTTKEKIKGVTFSGVKLDMRKRVARKVLEAEG
jgi:hypothetical protein